MANAAIAGTNKAAAASIAASSQAPLMPAENLLSPDVSVRWRGKTSSDFFITSAVSQFDTIVVRGLTASAAATIRVRVSSIDLTGAAGDLFDSGVLSHGSQNFDARYGAVVCLLPASVTGLIRVDINDPGQAMVEAGYLFATQRTEFTYNFAHGWSIQWEDRSAVQESRGGQDLIWRDNQRRRLTIDCKWITTTERYGVVEEIDRVNGRRDNVLIVIDTESDNLARDAILGLAENLTPIVQPDAVFAEDGEPMFAKQYLIKERL